MAGVVGVLCALVLLAGVGVVFADVVFRYGFGSPLEWGDEVAMAVLIAITFLGGALTLHRAEHLGVRALRSRLSGRWAERADGFVAWIVLVVSACLAWASVPLLDSVAGQTTISGLLPASIDYWPLLAGGSAMAAFALFQLARVPMRAMLVSGAVAVGGAAVAVAWGRGCQPGRDQPSG